MRGVHAEDRECRRLGGFCAARSGVAWGVHMLVEIEEWWGSQEEGLKTGGQLNMLALCWEQGWGY